MFLGQKKGMNEVIDKIHFENSEPVQKFSIFDNLLLSFDLVEEVITDIGDEVTDKKQIKKLVLFLNNAIELLFKVMLFSREEILLYEEKDSKNILEQYKKAREAGYTSLELYFEDNHLENQVHTISFRKACDLLESYYEVITPQFAQKCRRLARIRNGLMHSSTLIEYHDVISMLILYKEGYELLVNESERIVQNLNFFGELSIPVQRMMDYATVKKLTDLCKREEIKHLREREIFYHIIGYIIDNRSMLYYQNVRDYAGMEEKFFKHYSEYYEKNELKKWKKEFQLVYPILVDLCIIRTEDIDEFYSTVEVDKDVLLELRESLSDVELSNKLKLHDNIVNYIHRNDVGCFEL